jgi:hypothetical protein
MNASILVFRGKPYSLLYNGQAYFTAEDILKKYAPEPGVTGGGENTDIVAVALGNLAACCELAEMLSEQGELYRRYMGHEPGGILKIEGGGLLLSPVEAISLRTAVLESISRGLLREVEPEAGEEIDLGLEELAKKNIGG